MTEGEAQKQPKNASDPKFERWILRDAWDGFWRNFPVVVLAVLAMALIGVVSLNNQVKMVHTVSVNGFYLKVESSKDAVSFFSGFGYIFVSSILVYTMHSTLLDKRTCWAAFNNEQRNKVTAFLKRVSVMMLTYLVISWILQQALWQLAVENGAPAENSFGAIVFALVSVPSLLALSIFGFLIISWPGSVFLNGDQSLKRAIARGKKTFWFVIGKSLMVIPALVPLQFIMMAVLLPMMNSLFLNGSGAPKAEFEGISFGALVPFSLLSSIYFAVAFCIAGVIVSRALLVGEARLGSTKVTSETTENLADK